MNKTVSSYLEHSKVLSPYLDKYLLIIITDNVLNAMILISPLLLKCIIDYAYPNHDIGLLFIFLTLSFGLIIMAHILSNLSTMVSVIINQLIHQKILSDLYAKLVKLPIRFYKKSSVGDLLYRSTNDVEILVSAITNIPIILVTNTLKIIVLLAITFSLNPWICVIALVGVPINLIQTHFFSKKLKMIQTENQKLNSNLYTIMNERISNIKLIKTFNRQSKEVSQLSTNISELMKIERKNILTASIKTLSQSSINQIWTLMTGVYTGYLVTNNALTIGGAIAITSYISLLLTPFDKLVNLYSFIVVSSVSLKRIDEMILEPEEMDSEIGIKKFPKNTDIHIKNISFAYDNSDEILKNLSIDIPAKSALAIVGRSGTGKTSIIELLLRIDHPTEGEILIGDTPISKIALKTVRQNIKLVSQDIHLNKGTIESNICYGLDKPATKSKINKAITLAGATEFIEQQPGKLNSMIAEKGANLSGGQKQRIAIAQALITDPKIIILDEATSALDSESDKYIQNTIDTLKKTKTVIIVAHRLTSIKNADKIVVLSDNGNIAEQGTFGELMKAKQAFYRMYEHQTGGFQIFLEQLRIIIKAADRYNRPLSGAMLIIEDGTDQAKSINKFSNILSDIVLLIKLNLREVDLVGSNNSGEIFIIFPETDAKGAKIACQRIDKLIKDSYFEEIGKNKIKAKYRISNYKKGDQWEDLVAKIKKAKPING